MKKMHNWVLSVILLMFAFSLEAQTDYQTISDANFRRGPGTKYKSIEIINTGTKVYVHDKSNSSWYRVEYNGNTGYISSKYLSPIIVPPTIETTPPTKDPAVVKTSNKETIGGVLILLTILLIVLYKRKKNKPQPNTIAEKSQPYKEKNESDGNTLGNIPKVSTKMNLPDNFHNRISFDASIEANELPNITQKETEVISASTVYDKELKPITSSSTKATGKTYDSLQNRVNNYQGPPENNSKVTPIKIGAEKQQTEHDPTIIDVESLGYNTHIIITTEIVTKEPDQIDQRINTIPETETTYNPALNAYPGYIRDGNYWGLGAKYKTKLNLTPEQVSLLNRQWADSNNFCCIDFCCEEVIKLYLLSLRLLNETLIKENKTLDQQISTVVDTVLKKHFRFKHNSFNYKNTIESVTNEIHISLFKFCENTVRSHYGHKRKRTIDPYFSTTEAAQSEFDTYLANPLNNILPTLISTIAPPDEKTEITLNEQNTSRWKDQFEKIAETHKDSPSEFMDQVIRLGKLNQKNPSIENIFYEASKFIAKRDKETALTLYTHYLYHDLKSTTIDNKQLTKTIQKSIFQTSDQLKAFECIVSNLVTNKNLSQALKSIPDIFAVKRKKIKLDILSIKEAEGQHAETVDRLNEYLRDDYEDEANTIRTQEKGDEELIIQITSKSEEEQQESIYQESLAFSAVHIEVIDIFTKSNFSLVKKELEAVIKPKGLFVNQVIENINETCYETLNDLLIEEEDEYLTIHPDYYQRILKK